MPAITNQLKRRIFNSSLVSAFRPCFSCQRFVCGRFSVGVIRNRRYSLVRPAEHDVSYLNHTAVWAILLDENHNECRRHIGQEEIGELKGEVCQYFDQSQIFGRCFVAGYETWETFEEGAQ